ncbi:MAG TPA: hypothetical protein VGB19_01715 [Actinomycetota bacterium]
MSAGVASADSLPRLEGYPFQVRYSESSRADAERLADLTGEAFDYFTRVLEASPPRFTAFFLAPEEWKLVASPEGYGMARYQPAGFAFDEEHGPSPENRMIVPTDENAMWRQFGRMARLTSPFVAYPRLKRVYADAEGRLRARGFFDLLILRDVAYAIDEHSGSAFPALWLENFFPSLALHAFIATKRPGDLERLTTLPDVLTRLTALNAIVRLTGYRTLDDFQRHYPIGTEKPMKVPNYAWYHCRFLRLARAVFEESGEDGLKRLWAFGLSESTRHQSGWAYFREHGVMPPTDWAGVTSAAKLAPILATEVSPRLAQAIAEWP